MGGIGKAVANQVVSSDIIGNMAGLYGEKKSLGDAVKGKLASDDLGNTLHLNDPVAAPALPAVATQAAVAATQPAAANELIARKRAAQRTARGVSSTILSDSETLG